MRKDEREERDGRCEMGGLMRETGGLVWLDDGAGFSTGQRAGEGRCKGREREGKGYARGE
jgi:hypothetical protein